MRAGVPAIRPESRVTSGVLRLGGLVVALGAVLVLAISTRVGDRAENATTPAHPCERLAADAFLGLERAAMDPVTNSPIISVGRDATATVVQSCSSGPLGGTLRLSRASGTLAPTGGWVTTEEPWKGAAFVFPPFPDTTLSVQDESGRPLAIAKFADTRPTVGTDCILSPDASVRPIGCGFNLVVSVPAPDGLKDASDLESLVPTASFGTERKFLQAYVYGVTDSSDGSRVTVSVQRPLEAGPIEIRWDEMTLVGGDVQHPSESYSFNFVPVS